MDRRKTRPRLPLSLIAPLVIAMLAANISLALADDAVNALGNVEPDPLNEKGGFLEIGIGAGYADYARIRTLTGDREPQKADFGLAISGAYRYKRAFIEATNAGFDGLNTGVSLVRNDHWAVDVLLANFAGTLDTEKDRNPAPATDIDKERALIERDTFFTAAGVRATRYFDNGGIAQLKLVSDYFDSNGVIATARVGQQWQVGNWSWSGYIGAKYHSERFNHYLYSISPEEASQRFPAFQSNAAVILNASLRASRPISRNWVFSSRLNLQRYPNAIANSPLLEDDHDVEFFNNFSYVF